MSTEIKQRQRRTKGFRLTSTDKMVLAQIGKFGFQTYNELRSESLSQHGRSHSWAKMQRLAHEGLVIAVPSNTGKIDGWMLTNQGRQEIKDIFGNIKPVSAPLYKTPFKHDVVVRDMQRILCLSPNIRNWKTEQELRAEAYLKMRSLTQRERVEKLRSIPDAIFEIKMLNKPFKGALEVELNRKTKERTYRRFENHILSPDFDFIFFISDNELLQNFLMKTYRDVLSTSVRIKAKAQHNGIYFTTLENLQRSKLAATFQGLNHAMRFDKIS